MVHDGDGPADWPVCGSDPSLRAARSTPSTNDRRRATRQSEQATRADDGPIVYSVPEVLRRLGVTRPTIYGFFRSGELRSFRLGTRRLVSAEALADFIRSRESAEAG